jgi:hypothetical protein
MDEIFQMNRKPPPFPDDLVDWPLASGLLGEFSEKYQADPALIFNALAGCTSVAVSAAYDVEFGNGIVVPTSLYLLTIAESGERKTTVYNELTRVIYEFEKKENEKKEN